MFYCLQGSVHTELSGKVLAMLKKMCGLHSYCAFTFPEKTETDTNNKYTEPIGNLGCHLSLCSVTTSIQPYSNLFLSGLVSALVSNSVNTPLVVFAVSKKSSV